MSLSKIPRTIRVTWDAYKLIESMAQQTGQSMTDTASGLVVGNLVEFKRGMDKLTEVVQDLRGGAAPLSRSNHDAESRVILRVISQAGAERQPGSQLANPNDNAEKVESAEAVAEAVAHPAPDIDESGDRGPESGLASPTDENEEGAGRWLGLGGLVLVALIALANARPQGQVYRGSM